MLTQAKLPWLLPELGVQRAIAKHPSYIKMETLTKTSTEMDLCVLIEESSWTACLFKAKFCPCPLSPLTREAPRYCCGRIQAMGRRAWTGQLSNMKGGTAWKEQITNYYLWPGNDLKVALGQTICIWIFKWLHGKGVIQSPLKSTGTFVFTSMGVDQALGVPGH